MRPNPVASARFLNNGMIGCVCFTLKWESVVVYLLYSSALT